MNATAMKRVEAFLAKWHGSEGNERANYQTFLGDLCVALGVESPPPKGKVPGDPYCFDKDIKFYSEKTESTKFADFYKEGCFLLEAKQGSDSSGKGHGKRGTKAYQDAMQKAFNQAKSYAYNRMLSSMPPFLITCDIGSHFEIWEGFSGDYGSYGARQRVNLVDLKQPEVCDRFVKIFTDPQSLNPEKYRARVTREVAAELAKLSRWLEENPPHPLAPAPTGGAGGQDGSDLLSPRTGEGQGERVKWQVPSAIKQKMLEVARQFRKEPTPSEEILWQALRRKQLDGRKFRRQQPIGHFIVDFFCATERLIVEVDGGVHESQRVYDQERQRLLESLGLRFVRVTAQQVEADLSGTLTVIRQAFAPHPLAPVPTRGEGEQDGSDLPSPHLGEGSGERVNHPQTVANFLMRCIFTMFAEDVGLLKGEVFTKALRDRWIPHPETFKPEIEQLWQTMNTGGSFGFERILRFNGSFFENATAFALPKSQLEVLYAAAAKDWSQVEPAIFGTLLERALEKKERSRLGAHYTPRSYVERLVRPVVMEPLRQEWDEIEIELKRLLEPEPGKEEPTANQRKKAEQEIRTFLTQLRTIRILDPACGTGNFLYVALDLLKGLEQEVQTRLVDVAGNVQLNVLEQINPSQFLGIEINPRAAAIAELVIWIGYLQWYFKRYGNASPPEPVLQAFGNIKNRDAVLAYDGKEPDVDAKTGQVRTRWGGRMMRHPVTGEEVPDPSDQVVIYKYLNPRPAEWPAADYVVSNPPFIGNYKMRESLGDGYVETLRDIYKNVPEGIDYVMYWWHKAASGVRNKLLNSFGFITTNSIQQVWQRKVIEAHMNCKNPIHIFWAVADHPWVDAGAAVRISMTAANGEDNFTLSRTVFLGKVIDENEEATPEESADRVKVEYQKVGAIHSNLQSGANITQLNPILANSDLVSRGVMPGTKGFQVDPSDKDKVETELQKKYLNGRDLLHSPREMLILDTGELSEENLKISYPKTYQYLLERVKPDRETNNDPKLRRLWWLYRRANTILRSALEGLERYIVVPETSKHRVFVFLDKSFLPDNTLVAIGLDDGYFLGTLSSRVHVTWSLAVGGRLEDRPKYTKTLCFDRFPFPDPTPEQKQKIRELGERLDAHRKRVQAAHPDITITGMYNLLEKLRAGEPFTDADRAYNDRALVSTLKQIHDELDVAVLEAYGWEDLVPLLAPHPLAPSPLVGEGGQDGSNLPAPHLGEGQGVRANLDEIILERLVALNADRAAEERNGVIRWLRPEYQAPDQVQPVQTAIAGLETTDNEPIVEPIEQRQWPTQPKAQLAAIRDLLRTSSSAWTVAQIAAQFTGKNTKKKLEGITDNLERLEFFGLVIPIHVNGTITWQWIDAPQVA